MIFFIKDNVLVDMWEKFFRFFFTLNTSYFKLKQPDLKKILVFFPLIRGYKIAY